jgi:hypothetical protein
MYGRTLCQTFFPFLLCSLTPVVHPGLCLCFSTAQETPRLLNYPGLGTIKHSVLMDQLITLKPDWLDDVIQDLKMSGYIQDVVNP